MRKEDVALLVGAALCCGGPVLLVGLGTAGPAIAAAAGAARPVVPLAALAGGPVVLWARRHGRSRATPPSTLTESR